MVAIAYAALAVLATGVEHQHLPSISIMWMLLFYVMVSIGEVLLQPVALSEIGRQVPRRFEMITVGAWYVSLAIGGLVAGIIGSALEKKSFAEIFWLLSAIAALGGASALGLRPVQRRLLANIARIGN